MKKRFLTTCALLALFLTPEIQAKERRLYPEGIPHIRLHSLCVNDSVARRILSMNTDTSENIICEMYTNNGEKIIVTRPLMVSNEKTVFVFKVIENNCLTFLFKEKVQSTSVEVYCDEKTYYINSSN